MNRHRILLYALAFSLIGFIASSWGGLVQWWQSMPFLHQFIGGVLLAMVLAGVLSRYTQWNPIIVFSAMVGLALVACMLYWLVLLCRK